MKKYISSPTRSFVLSLCAIIALMGCSVVQSGTPSESDAKAFFVNGIYKEMIQAGLIKVESFKKTNAIKSVESGVEKYVLEYQATVLYPEGVMPQCITGEFSNECFLAQTKDVHFKKIGKREMINGKIEFEKAEKGWRPTGIFSQHSTKLDEKASNYQDQAKFKAVFNATAPFKLAVDVCAQNMDSLAACTGGNNGVPANVAAAAGVVAVSIGANGVITATTTMSNNGVAGTYTLTPTLTNTPGKPVTWVGVCNPTTMC